MKSSSIPSALVLACVLLAVLCTTLVDAAGHPGQRKKCMNEQKARAKKKECEENPNLVWVDGKPSPTRVTQLECLGCTSVDKLEYATSSERSTRVSSTLGLSYDILSVELGVEFTSMEGQGFSHGCYKSSGGPVTGACSCFCSCLQLRPDL